MKNNNTNVHTQSPARPHNTNVHTQSPARPHTTACNTATHNTNVHIQSHARSRRIAHNIATHNVRDSKNPRIHGARNACARAKQQLRKWNKNSTLTALLIFWVIALLQFSFFFTNFGPLTCTDAEMHIPGGYALATGQSFNVNEDPHEEGCTCNTKANGQEINMPKNMVHNLSTYNSKMISAYLCDVSNTYSHTAIDEKYDAQREALTDVRESSTAESCATRANQYIAISYIPTAIGMKVGIALGKTSWGILQLARLTNFAIWILLFSASIVIIPRARGLLATIGLLPHTLFCASSVSSDAFLIGLCALYVAMACKFLICGQGLKKHQMTAVALLTLLIMLIKPVYGALALIYIFLPREIWSTKTKLIVCTATFVLFLILYLSWSMNYQYLYLANDYDRAVDLAKHNIPYVIACCAFNTLIHIFECMRENAAWFTVFVFAVLIFAIVIYRLKFNKYCALSVAIVLLAMMLTFLFLFLTWNDVDPSKMSVLSGFQERYLIPLLPLIAFVCCANTGVTQTKTNNSFTSKLEC